MQEELDLPGIVRVDPVVEFRDVRVVFEGRISEDMYESLGSVEIRRRFQEAVEDAAEEMYVQPWVFALRVDPVGAVTVTEKR